MKVLVSFCMIAAAGALQQFTFKNEASDWPLPVLKPKTHSYFSTNPEGTAKFMLRYFSGTNLLSDMSVSDDKYEIRVIEYCAREQCMNMRFVEDKSAPESSLPPADFVKTSDADMERVGYNARQKEVDYSPWVDIHDGIMADGFNVDLAIKDKINFQKYQGAGPVRINLPYTIFTLEIVCCFGDNEEKLREYSGVKQPEHCRSNTDCSDNVEPAQTPLTWYKVTYATPDMKAAVDFAVHALGAVRKVNPFDDPSLYKPGYCTEVEWVIIPDRDYGVTEEQAAVKAKAVHDCTIENKDGEPIKGLSLHFVVQPSYPQGNLTVDQLAKEQGEICSKDMMSDKFNQHMHSHVELETASLDPFIARFQKLNLPFIVRKGKESFAVYVNEPKNGLIFKITSAQAPTRVQALLADE